MLCVRVSMQMTKNGAEIILLFHFWPYLFYTIFKSFLEKVFVSIEKRIFSLYNIHNIVFIASEMRENCRLLDNSVFNVFHKV